MNMNESLSWLRRDAANARKPARKQGMAGITQRQRDRLADIVAYARQRSPYYARLYDGLPDRIAEPALLPVTDKKTFDGHFDDWATDREIRLANLTAFVDNPDVIGHRFLGKYLAATISGTTGHRGLFALDDHNANVASALGAVAYRDLGVRTILRLAARGMRTAIIGATGGHYVGFASYSQVTRETKLQSITIERADEPPRQEPGGGKSRTVIPLKDHGAPPA